MKPLNGTLHPGVFGAGAVTLETEQARSCDVVYFVNTVRVQRLSSSSPVTVLAAQQRSGVNRVGVVLVLAW